MREIKFRAWDPTTKRMIKSEHVLNHWYRFYNQSQTVMQYTGLKDKNGKEIYEGDIVRGFMGRVGVVKFGEHCDFDYYAQPRTGWYYEVEVGDVYSISPSLGDFENIVIIGNIHENKELLNAG